MSSARSVCPKLLDVLTDKISTLDRVTECNFFTPEYILTDKCAIFVEVLIKKLTCESIKDLLCMNRLDYATVSTHSFLAASLMKKYVIDRDLSDLDKVIVHKSAWRDVMFSNSIRQRCGRKYLMDNCSSIEVVRSAMNYTDLIDNKLFVIIYKTALMSYNQEIVDLLRLSKYYVPVSVKLPQDY